MPGKKAREVRAGGKKKVAFRAAGRQLEATVHTSLPPRVQGPLRAYVRVCVSSIVWEYNIGPPASKLCVAVKWWGEESPGTIFRVPVLSHQKRCSTEESTTLAFYPVRAALPQLKAYLNDMKALKLLVGLGHMTEDSMVIGQCTLPDLSGLSETQPYENSLPIISSQGHVLGRLQVQMEIQVAKAGQTRLTTPAVDNTLQLPGFRVGPGAPVVDKQQELNTVQGSKARQISSWVKELTQKSDADLHRSAQHPSVASHKTALLAKYMDYHTQPGERSQSGRTDRHQSPADDDLDIGPQQRQVIAELIERGERLRDAMAASVLKSGRRGGGGGGGGGGRERGQDEGGPDTRTCDIYSSDGEGERGEEFSMDESDYPLCDPSLLEQLLYCTGGQKTELKVQSVDSAVQTVSHPVSPSPRLSPHPSTKPASMTTSHPTSPPSSPIPTPSSTTLPTSHTRHGTPPTIPSSHTLRGGGEGGGEGADTGSLTTLASFFSGQSLQKSMDEEILQAVGMERLTLLGRVTSCRVVVESLTVNPEQLAAAITHSMKTRSSLSVSATQRSGTFFVEYLFPASMAARGGRVRPQMGRGRGRGKGGGGGGGGGGRGGGGRGGGGGGGRGGGGGGKGVRSFPPPHEVVRVASKKIQDGVVRFGHRSMFPVSLVGHVMRQWWHDVMVFSVYYRPPTDRAPFLLGKGRVPFRQWLVASSSSRVEVAVINSLVMKKGGTDTAEGNNEDNSDEKTLGKLAVSVQLLCGRGTDQELPCGDTATTELANSDRERGRREGRERGREVGDEEEGTKDRKWSPAPPIRVKETQTITTKDIDLQPSALQLLLMLPEGRELGLPAERHASTEPPAGSRVAPNCYLVCRLFCASPHPRTTTVWATSNPHFNFKQVFPLYLTPSLLEQVCNNFIVVEAWHKTPGTTTDDELLGLVKLSLHQFYLAFSDDASAALCLHAQLPVIAVDCYCPVISPFTGNEQGHLAVLLAMGSAHQITTLQQQFAAGSYVLHRSYSKSQTPALLGQPVVQQSQIGRPNEECGQSSGPVHHTFDVTVSGVHGLSVFNSTVWGEADCFVQYHFPHVTEQQSGEEEEGEVEGEDGAAAGLVSLQTFRTDMTLCVPNPTFTHETRHSLPLPPAHPVQRAIMRACGSSGGVTFELWRRFYYPNIRDQLVAKASLPLAKLCALVSMQRMAGPTVQSFSLPMKLVFQEAQGGSGGLLEVTVQYQSLQDEQQQLVAATSQQRRTHATLAVEVIRATGLKDAAVLAAQQQPVPLGFAAEVGTNNYAKISFPDFLEEKRTTKTVTRSFAPDFSHSFDFALPLVSRETIHPYTVTVPLAQRLAECSAVIEIWHQIPKNDTRPAPIAGKVFGRRLASSFKDVCLGHTVIPLISLLEKQTGVRGWFPLYPPLSNSVNHESAPESISNPDLHTACHYVGGVEVSLSFSSDDERKSILARGLEMGWKPPESNMSGLDELLELYQGGKGREGEREGGCLRNPVCWRFCVNVTELLVPIETVAIAMLEDPAPYLYCFLRYRFFDSDEVISRPRALSYCREGRGCYQLSHRVTVTLTGSHELEWYIQEESMEIEVWSCPTRRRPGEGEGEGEGAVPVSGDILLGTTTISLQPLSSESSVSGSYPVFKAGEASLGNQLLVVHIEKSVAKSPEPQSDAKDLKTTLEILDMSDDDDFVPLEPVSEGSECKTEGGRRPRESHEQGEGGEGEGEGEGERHRDMFETRLVIHEALHLPMMTDKTQEREWPPCAYVTLHPHPKVDKIVTEAIPGSLTPHWNHQCLTHIPNLYLDTHCPGLEFQVWSKSCSSSPSTDDGQSEDSYIGCVHVDLSALAFGLPQISGWYNITDFSGQIQGQIKVSIVPSKGVSSSSGVPSYVLPCTHVMLSACPTLPQPSAESLSHGNPVQPAPSFMEKTSSVLLKRLRDNLNELDQINSSLKAKTPDTTEAPDLKSLSHQLTAAYTTQPSPTTSITTTTTQASLVLDYSSSGPTLEQHSLNNDDTHANADGLKEGGIRVPFVYESEASTTSSSGVPSPHKDPVEPREVKCDAQVSYSQSISSSTPPEASLSPDTLTLSAPKVDTPPGCLQEHNTCDHTLHSETSSLHVEVDDVSAPQLSETAHSSEGDSPRHSLTDVSTCSSRDESTLSAVEQQQQCDGMKDEGTITTATVSNQPLLKSGKGKGIEHERETSEGSNNREGGGEHATVQTTGVSRSVFLHSCSISEVTAHQVPNAHVGGMKNDGQEIGAIVNDTESVSRLPGNPSSQCSHSAAHDRPAELPPVTTAKEQLLQPLTNTSRRRKTNDATKITTALELPPVTTAKEQLLQPLTNTSSTQMPEISLPNFFMPPQELEHTMRSLRASALTRPPPRKLFGGHNLPPQSQPDSHNSSHTVSSSSSQWSAVRTLRDVNQFLKLRRAGGDTQLQASSTAQHQTLSDKAAQRLSRIFTSRPPQTHSEN